MARESRAGGSTAAAAATAATATAATANAKSEPEEIAQIRNLESNVLDKTRENPPSQPQRAPQSDSYGSSRDAHMPEVMEQSPPVNQNFSAPPVTSPDAMVPQEAPPVPASQSAMPPQQSPQSYAGLNYTSDIAGADTGGIQVRKFVSVCLTWYISLT